MTYAARETSGYLGAPFELFRIETATEGWFLTSGDTLRGYNSKTYTPDAITRSEINQNQESQSGEIKITIPRTHDIASRFISYIPVSPMSVVIYRGHDGDPDYEVVTNFTGRVVKAEFGDDCVLTVVPESDILRKRIPAQKYQAQCNWVLFSAGCGVNRDDFSVDAVLSSVESDVIKAAAFADKANGWFQNGYIEHGQERRMILTHSGDTIRLISPMSGLSVGSSVKVFAGCQRTTSDCASRFSNLVRFWGFDKIPTRNPFDGGLT